MTRHLRCYIAILLETAGARVAAALALMIAFSLTEGVGIALLLPTLQVAGLDLTRQGRAGRYAALVTRALATVRLPATLLVLLAIFIALVSARAFLSRAHTIAACAVDLQVTLEMRRRLYGAIVNADWLSVARARASDLVHALTAELDRIAVATRQLMMLAADAILILLYVLVAIGLSPAMTAMVLGCGLLLAFLLRGRTRAIEESGAAISQANNAVYAAAAEHLSSLKTVKTYGAQLNSFALFAALSARVARATLDTARHQASAAAAFQVGSILALGAVLYVSIRVIAVPPAEILILLLLFSRVMPRFMSAHQSFQNFAGALPAFANVVAMQDRMEAAAEPADSPAERLPFRDAIRLERVSFAYGRDAGATLSDLDLVIPAGKVTAIVGPSGAGKSTIADLVMGLVAPDRGRVTIDGIALDPAHARAWRRQLGYVGQETFLFHDTIRANLLWARPDASEAAMRSALARAAAGEFVAALADGLDTVAGDRGILLSQGERQRLALARALLREPAMLVLDEATNSLDSENEARVLDALIRLRGKQTVMLIAHRLSTIRWADLIYVIEDGRVVEAGDWETLTARRGRFHALCESQSSESIARSFAGETHGPSAHPAAVKVG